jgi:hypothetical protein
MHVTIERAAAERRRLRATGGAGDVGEVQRRQASVLDGGDSRCLVRRLSELIETSVPARVDAGRRRRSKG